VRSLGGHGDAHGEAPWRCCSAPFQGARELGGSPACCLPGCWMRC
jgi:hypothetical protein